jgi:hypothetical protein
MLGDKDERSRVELHGDVTLAHHPAHITTTTTLRPPVPTARAWTTPPPPIAAVTRAMPP